MFNIYLNLLIFLKIYYTVLLFTFLTIFLNKTQTLSSPHIVYVGLVLFSRLFDYKFAPIYSDAVLILNLILIMVIKKKKKNYPTRSTWVGLDPYNGLC